MIKKMAYLSALTSLIGANIIAINFVFFQLSLFRIVLLLMTFVTILKLQTKGGIAELTKNENSYSIKFMIIWFIYALISLGWVHDYQGWFKAVYFLGIGVLCVIIFNMTFDEDKEILNAFYAMSVMIIFHNAIGWYEVATGNYLFLTTSQKFYMQGRFPVSMFGNTNDYATFILIAIWILFICIINSKFKLVKLCYIITAVSSAALLTMTGSRANILGFILSIAVFLYLSMKNKKGRVIAIGIFAVIFLIILVMPNFITEIIQNIKINLQFSDDSQSDFVRQNLIKNGTQFLLSTFGFGTGAGNIEYWMSNFGTYYTYGVTNIHNWWMEVLAGYGVFIFILYLLFYGGLIKSLYKRYKSAESKIELSMSLGLLCSMMGFIIGSVSSSSNIGREWLWVFWSLVISFQGMSHDQDISASVLSK